MGESAEAMQLRRLRAFALMDTGSAIIGAVTMLVVYGTVAPLPSLLMATAVVAAAAAIMASSLIPLGRCNPSSAVVVLAVANWWAALGATTIATFAWPVLVTASLIPAMLAGSYFPHRRVQHFVFISLAVSLAVAALGLLQDVTGLSDELPAWIRTLVLIAFTPFLSSMVVFLALQGSRCREVLMDELVESRTRIVAAADRERRRIERDIHDGAQQHLVALALQVQRATQLVSRDSGEAIRLLGAVRRELHTAQVELRNLAQGIYPPALTEHGLVAALETVAGQSPMDVRLRADETIGRLRPDLEAAVYFCCIEAIQNAFRHGGSGVSASVVLSRPSPTSLRFFIADTGRGMPDDQPGTGTGVQNMIDRMGAIGGRLSISSTPGGGTRVSGEVPTPVPSRSVAG